MELPKIACHVVVEVAYDRPFRCMLTSYPGYHHMVFASRRSVLGLETLNSLPVKFTRYLSTQELHCTTKEQD